MGFSSGVYSSSSFLQKNRLLGFLGEVLSSVIRGNLSKKKWCTSIVARVSRQMLVLAAGEKKEVAPDEQSHGLARYTQRENMPMNKKKNPGEIPGRFFVLGGFKMG